MVTRITLVVSTELLIILIEISGHLQRQLNNNGFFYAKRSYIKLQRCISERGLKKLSSCMDVLSASVRLSVQAVQVLWSDSRCQSHFSSTQMYEDLRRWFNAYPYLHERAI